MRYVIRGGKKHLLGPARPDPGIEPHPPPPRTLSVEGGGVQEV